MTVNCHKTLYPKAWTNLDHATIVYDLPNLKLVGIEWVIVYSTPACLTIEGKQTLKLAEGSNLILQEHPGHYSLSLLFRVSPTFLCLGRGLDMNKFIICIDIHRIGHSCPQHTLIRGTITRS